MSKSASTDDGRPNGRCAARHIVVITLRVMGSAFNVTLAGADHHAERDGYYAAGVVVTWGAAGAAARGQVWKPGIRAIDDRGFMMG